MSALPFNLATQTLPFDDPSAATTAAYAQLHGGRVMPSLDAHDERRAAVYVAARAGRDCAVKPLPGVRAESLRVVRWSRALEALPPHSNVVKPLHIAFTRGHSYLVMPYVHAYSVAEYRARVHGGQPLPEAVVRMLALDVLCGLYHLRLHNLAHRAVHPDNVLVDAHTGVARVTDLSYCAVLPHEPAGGGGGGGGVIAAVSLAQLPASSRAWADPARVADDDDGSGGSNSGSGSTRSSTTTTPQTSPTVVQFDSTATSPPREQQQPPQQPSPPLSSASALAAATATDTSQATTTTAADVWGFGVVLHAMCSNSGKPFVYDDKGDGNHRAAATGGGGGGGGGGDVEDALVTREYAGTHYSDELYDLLRRCLQRDASRRPTLFQLYKHAFLFPALLIALETSRVQAQRQLDGVAGGEATGLVGGASAAVARVAQQMRDAGVAGSVGWALTSLRERASAVVSSLMTPAAQEAQLLAHIRPDGGQPQLPRQPHMHDDVDSNNNNNNNMHSNNNNGGGGASSIGKVGGAAAEYARDGSSVHKNNNNSNEANSAAAHAPLAVAPATALTSSMSTVGGGPAAATTTTTTTMPVTTAMANEHNVHTTLL